MSSFQRFCALVRNRVEPRHAKHNSVHGKRVYARDWQSGRMRGTGRAQERP